MELNYFSLFPGVILGQAAAFARLAMPATTATDPAPFTPMAATVDRDQRHKTLYGCNLLMFGIS
jgi:hypothetical protein